LDLVNVDDDQYDRRVGEATSLSAKEAAERLGVKPQTLYAYVSRGLIRRTRPAGSRLSRYDRDDVERVATRARPVRGRAGPEIAVDSAITRLDPAGHLAYRGWDVTRAATEAHYEQVAAWLWGTTFGPHDHWAAAPEALRVARRVQAALPATAALPDRLRVVAAALRACDPLRDDRRVPSVAARAATLLATLVEALPPADPRGPTDPFGSLAARLWTRVSRLEPTDRRVRSLDCALILLADHELAASTLAARVAASTWADPYLVVLAGLAAAGGPLPADEAVGQTLRDAGEVPGFGHRVYAGADPRVAVLLDAVRRSEPPRAVWRAVDAVLDVVARDEGPSPTVDFALGALAEANQMVDGAGEVIFTVARVAGWIAHGLEEYPHRLRYRVRATYTGPQPEEV
jgi:citrate synthase